jgi:translation elongation factor EF-4
MIFRAARESARLLAKNATAKCCCGDAMRKLLDRQKEGQKRMR